MKLCPCKGFAAVVDVAGVIVYMLLVDRSVAGLLLLVVVAVL